MHRMLVVLALVVAFPARAQESRPVGTAWIRQGIAAESRPALEVALRRYVRDDGTSVSLVGVAHIGDKSFYDALQRTLDGFDAVLYESVLPDGASRPEGETDEERREATLRSLKFLADRAGDHRRDTGAWPATAEVLAKWSHANDPRLGHGVENAADDAWGRAVVFAIDATADTMTVRAQPPGDAAPIEAVATPSKPATKKKAGGGVQKDLAIALGLAYQLDAIDYTGPRWVHADASIGDVERGIRKRGGNFAQLNSMLTGSGALGSMMGLMINLLKASSDGMKSDMKFMLIEVLASADERTRSMLGKGVAETIVDERNRVAFRELDRLLDRVKEPRNYAIFYGALHLDDMAKRLADRGFKPVDERWMTVLTTDPDRGDSPMRRQLRGAMNRASKKDGTTSKPSR